MRLIDADALINDRETFIVIGAGDNICIDIADINKAPTIEAKPVVHGEWKPKKHKLFGNTYEHICSCCGCDYALAEYYFCPNCGADMRGET